MREGKRPPRIDFLPCLCIFLSPGPTDPQVWFQDLSGCWHFIAKSFTDYFRLMVMHLGIPNWHYIFTDIGLDKQTEVVLAINGVFHTPAALSTLIPIGGMFTFVCNTLSIENFLRFSKPHSDCGMLVALWADVLVSISTPSSSKCLVCPCYLSLFVGGI